MKREKAKKVKPKLPLYAIDTACGIAIRDADHHCIGVLDYRKWVDDEELEVTRALIKLINANGIPV